MSGLSESRTKQDEQYEKRVLMTALILENIKQGGLDYAKLASITPKYFNYAKNDAIKYLIKHNYIKIEDGVYHLV